jgi:uncharacterized protein
MKIRRKLIMSPELKTEMLKKIIEDMESVAVAYSGGVDSTFLIKYTHDILGDKAIAVTARSSSYPKREFKEAADYAKKIGIKQIVIDSKELDNEEYAKNPKNRCYFCKKELFSKIIEVAKENGIKYVVDGSNFDDLYDYRPGRMAINELSVRSPLIEAKLTKDEIRSLSKNMDLPTWNKPAFACLASRIPYGNPISSEKLTMIEQAEQYLMDLGFIQFRVRHHGDVARIEVPQSEIEKFFYDNTRDKVYNKFKEFGFAYTAIDLMGYRTGSMNETIK